jgi:hypothetical protein
MGIFYSNNPLDWFATDGTYINEQQVPQAPTIEGTNVVQVVGDFPWGEPNVIHRISDTPTLVDTLFGKASNPVAYGGVKALTGKFFPILEIVRAVAADAAKASRTIGANGFKATAKYVGAVGNEIAIEYTNNGDDTFDFTVTWNGYQRTFAGAELATVADLEDEYLVFETVGTGDTLEASDAGGAVNLTGGDDGTFVDADFTGGVADVRGLRILEAGEDSAIAFIAERASAAITSAMQSFVAEKRAFGFTQGNYADLSDVDAATAIAGAVSDDRLGICLHGVRQRINGTVYDVHMTAFAASVLASLPPHFGLADEDACRRLLKSVLGPVTGSDLSRAAQIAADDAGGILLENLGGGAYKFHANLTTDTTKPLISSRRVTDIAAKTIGTAIAPFTGKPNMQAYKRLALAQAQSAIKTLKGNPEIPQTSFIEDAGVVAVPGAVANSIVYQLAILRHGEIRYQIVNLVAGESIVIEDVIGAAA